jgi:hypothetical protein
VLDRFLGGLVPAEVVDTVGEVDVGFVEDCCPLKGCLLKKQMVRIDISKTRTGGAKGRTYSV